MNRQCLNLWIKILNATGKIGMKFEELILLAEVCKEVQILEDQL